MTCRVLADSENFVKESHRENNRSRRKLKYRLNEIAKKLSPLFGANRRPVAIGHVLPPRAESAIHLVDWNTGSDLRSSYFFEQLDELLFALGLVVPAFGV